VESILDVQPNDLRHSGAAQRNPETSPPALVAENPIGNATTLVSGFRYAAPE
jgi:hypothetical protein